MTNNQITLVFLLRNGPDSWEHLDKFLRSLERFPGGYPCKKLVLLKGFTRSEIDTNLPKYNLDRTNTFEVPDTNYDLGSYFYALKKISTKYAIFFNSYARPQAKDWLEIYESAARENKSGLVGATGSYESRGFTSPMRGVRSFRKRFSWAARYAYRLITTVRDVRNNANFPNRHIRTNAFLTMVSVYENYILKYGLPESKRDCHLIESGPNSFTRHVESMGLNPGVVDATGQFFSLNNLHHAKGFRRGAQKKLLVSDNRTRDFQNASSEEKLSLEWDAWRDID